MTGFLLDTNIPSELTRPLPEPRVFRWLDQADNEQLYFSAVSLGEIVKGIGILPGSKRRAELQAWLDGTLRPWFAGRILPVDELVAEHWGALNAECKLKGTPLSTVDGMIAATALEHHLTVVTRNTKDFSGLGVSLFNPWIDDLKRRPSAHLAVDPRAFVVTILATKDVARMEHPTRGVVCGNSRSFAALRMTNAVVRDFVVPRSRKRDLRHPAPRMANSL